MTSSLDNKKRKQHPRTMSASVGRLQDAINIHLDITEKQEFVDILNEFYLNRDMVELVKKLKELLDTPAKYQLLALIKQFIPKSEVGDFEQLLGSKGRRFDTMPTKQPKKQRSRPPLKAAGTAGKVKSKAGKCDKKREESQSDSAKSHKGGMSSRNLKYSVKTGLCDLKQIQICQSADVEGGFGFSIRGGSEYGIGIYVSLVDKGGMAERQGLEPGDLLVEVNNISFENISHSEAAKIIRSSTKLDMVLSRVGRIPGSFVVHQMYKWVNPSGKPVSPPQELEHLGQVDSISRKSGFTLLKGPDERKINITVEKGQSLGLMIRGGREFGLGIYVSGVDQLSQAEQAGIKVGDQILAVNGRSFLDITHAEAVLVLKNSKYLMFKTKSIGKLPYARTKIDQTSWMSKTLHRKHRQRTDSQTSDGSAAVTTSMSSAFRKGIGSQLMYNTAISSKWDLIEDQAIQLLNETEQGTLRYYLSEYQAGFITVDGLAMASFELLNTKAKMSLMDEIRNWVQDRDLQKFDMLLQRRQAQERGQHRPGFSKHSCGMKSIVGHDCHMSEGLHHHYEAMSAPVSRVATVRERSRRRYKHITEWDMEPLRQAIQQIDDQFTSEHSYKHGTSSAFQRRRSYSTEFLHSPPPNLLKSSVSSRHSMSEETLTPVYIDTASDLPASPANRSRSRSKPGSNSASKRIRTWNTYAHRQRSGSNSTLRKKYRSVEDLGSASRKITPYPSRRNSVDGVNVTERPSSSIHFINVDVHEQPTFAATGQQADGSPSDDSGVEVNSHTIHDPSSNRVTISSDNPVNINDVLQNRSSVNTTPCDHGSQSNCSTLTNCSGQSHKSTTEMTSRRQDGPFSATSSPKVASSRGHLHPPVEIRINDGEGSIDTISLDSVPGYPSITNVSMVFQESTRGNLFESDVEDDDRDDDEDTLENSSDTGGDTQVYTPYIYMESRKIEDAKKRYGDVPFYIIPLYKTKPTLGMAIEGGANTRQPVPRVINLQPGGSAYESGSLKVGHKILEVNGKSLLGLEHITAAKTVAEAFKTTSEDCMELLVTDSDAVVKLTC